MPKHTKRAIIYMILFPVVITLISLGIELFLDRDILSIPAQQRKLQAVDLSELELDNAIIEDECIFNEEQASIKLTNCGYIGTFRISGTNDYGEELQISWNGKTDYILLDESTGVGSLQMNCFVNDLTVYLPEFTTIDFIQIDNSFQLNIKRILLIAILASGVYLLIAFNHFFGSHIEYGFLLVALLIGTYLCIAMPNGINISFDDQIHVSSILLYSQGILPAQNSNAESSDFWHVLEGGDTSLSNNPSTDDKGENVYWKFTTMGYLPSIAGLTLARLLGFSAITQIFMIRLFSMLAYVLLCFSAIRTLRRFKLLMSCIALMPTPMFLSASFSYDPFSTGLCFLGIAIAIRTITDNQAKMSLKYGLTFFISIVAGSMTKFVYLPLLLLMCVIPNSRFNRKSIAIYMKCASIAICLLGIVYMVTSVSSDLSTFQDIRGDNVNSADQLTFILRNPIKYLQYFFVYFFGHLKAYIFDSPRISLAFIGNLNNTISSISLVILLFVAFTDNDCNMRHDIGIVRRFAILLIAGIVVGIIFTTFYIAYSAVASPIFSGIHGRYMIPIIPLCYIFLSFDFFRNRLYKPSINNGILFSQLAILGYVCWCYILNYVPREVIG